MTDDEYRRAERRARDRQINSVSGGILLIWIGFALLFKIGWGAGLIGVGIVLLAEQFARQLWSIKFESSWLVVGVAALVIGILMTIEVKMSAVPIILIAIGVAMVASAFKRAGTKK
jgi:hypothetical protein